MMEPSLASGIFDDPNGVGSFFLLLVVILISYFSRVRRFPIRIPLSASKFWDVVLSQPHPVVIVTTRGFFRRICYLFAHHGILFHTDADRTEPQDGVKVVSSGNHFSLP
jgi:hypothetical protein